MRSYNRFIIDQEVECQIDGLRDFATLYNLSSGGCMIESPSVALVVGAHVLIDLKGYHRARGEVVWRINRNAGIKFDLPVHQSVINHLGYRDSVGEFEIHEPTDRFGLPLFG